MHHTVRREALERSERPALIRELATITLLGQEISHAGPIEQSAAPPGVEDGADRKLGDWRYKGAGRIDRVGRRAGVAHRHWAHLEASVDQRIAPDRMAGILDGVQLHPCAGQRARQQRQRLVHAGADDDQRRICADTASSAEIACQCSAKLRCAERVAIEERRWRYRADHALHGPTGQQ